MLHLGVGIDIFTNCEKSKGGVLQVKNEIGDVRVVTVKAAYHTPSVKREFPPSERNAKLCKLGQLPRYSQQIHTGLRSYHRSFTNIAKPL